MPQGRDDFRFRRGFYRTVRIPENPAAVSADIISIGAVLCTGGCCPRDSLQIMNMQGAIVDCSVCQSFIAVSNLYHFPLLGRTGVVDIF